jgi:hypothetical protein
MLIKIASSKPTNITNFGLLPRLGYWSLVLLVLSLPFELTQKPLFQTEFIVVSNLKLIFLVVDGLAALTLLIPLVELFKSFRVPTLRPSNYLYRQRLPLGLFLALLSVCLLSSLLSGVIGEGLKWTVHLMLGGLIWLAMPLWLAEETERRVRILYRTLVVGAVISAGVGFLEFILGRDFAWSLSGWFKLKPTEAGPFLRLSGTFEYANITAMYFELALPFAMFGLVESLNRPRSERKFWPTIFLWGATIMVLLMALLLTLSRGAWLGLAVGVLAMLLATRKPQLRRNWWLVFGITGVLALALELLALPLLPQFALRFNSQSDQDWFRATYDSVAPANLGVCQSLIVPVTVTNRSPLTWQINGLKPYSLSYHWLDASDNIIVFEGMRTALPKDVSPGDSLTIPAAVRAPANPGKYSLVWDMVQEDVSWFSLKSSFYSKIPIQVNNSPAGEACGVVSINPNQSKPAPKELPKVLIQPDRQQLWKAALAMIVARPLTGVGPNAFRLSYGTFSQPRLTDWDKRIFANNLALEIFADLGLVGGGLFMALFGVIGWRLLKLIWFGRGASLWQVALIGVLAAFQGHGLLDYILGSNAIFILYWILLGFMATRPNEK